MAGILFNHYDPGRSSLGFNCMLNETELGDMRELKSDKFFPQYLATAFDHWQKFPTIQDPAAYTCTTQWTILTAVFQSVQRSSTVKAFFHLQFLYGQNKTSYQPLGEDVAWTGEFRPTKVCP